MSKKEAMVPDLDLAAIYANVSAITPDRVFLYVNHSLDGAALKKLRDWIDKVIPLVEAQNVSSDLVKATDSKLTSENIG